MSAGDLVEKVRGRQWARPGTCPDTVPAKGKAQAVKLAKRRRAGIFFPRILPNGGTARCSPDPVILVQDALHGVVPRGNVSVGGYGLRRGRGREG